MLNLSKFISCCLVVCGLSSVQAIDNPNSSIYNSTKTIPEYEKNSQDTYYYQGENNKNIRENLDSQKRDFKNKRDLQNKKDYQNKILNPAGKEPNQNMRPNYLSYQKNSSSGETVTSDQELARRIKDKIGSGWFTKGYEDVTVDVKDGVVTLGGAVKTDSEKEKVEKEIRNFEGVNKLNSKITVREPSGKANERAFPQDVSSSPVDEQLNKKIRDNVSRGWLWNDYEDVAISTVNGVVTLKGSVDDHSDEQKLVEEIQKVEGVKSVKSNLTILNK